ncbi:MAG TPA: hypothetical protein VGR35_02965 [Tepidisphaeraceae bacterium]|nr:hypothetical protein [Tepidisphaeraceae bacterium]
MITTLPILMALSWVPTANVTVQAAPVPQPQQAQPLAQATDTIKCPVTGEQIPSCCCPVKK